MTTETGITSNLGTFSHWESVYDRELSNFQNNKEDPGDIWYGEGSQDDAIEFGVAKVKEMLWSEEEKIKAQSMEDQGEEECDWLKFDYRTLDLGCGNGCLTLKLLEEQWTDLTAADYVKESVELAEAVCLDGGFPKTAIDDEANYALSFSQDDLRISKYTETPFAVIFDKGTMDAFRLSVENTPSLYFNSVNTFLELNGLLILTSCNETIDDMIRDFDGPGKGGDFEWKYEGSFNSKKPKFSFGGVTGAAYTIVCFRRVK